LPVAYSTETAETNGQINDQSAEADSATQSGATEKGTIRKKRGKEVGQAAQAPYASAIQAAN
jgi:hypothetical protein